MKEVWSSHQEPRGSPPYLKKYANKNVLYVLCGDANRSLYGPLEANFIYLFFVPSCKHVVKCKYGEMEFLTLKYRQETGCLVPCVEEATERKTNLKQLDVLWEGL